MLARSIAGPDQPDYGAIIAGFSLKTRKARPDRNPDDRRARAGRDRARPIETRN
jgi:hypothetical protein